MPDGSETAWDAAHLVDMIKSLDALCAQSVHEGEALRRLPERLAEAFLGVDANRLLLPSALGGRGLDPLTVFDSTVHLASHNASAAWNFALASGSGVFFGYLNDDDALALGATKACGVAGSLAPTGKGVRVEGGIRLTGRWSWASGIEHAHWVVAGFLEFDEEEPRRGADGGPIWSQALSPKSAFQVLDTWRSDGLRGTGSTEFTAHDVFVPESRLFKIFREAPRRSEPIFQLPGVLFGLLIAAVPIGAALGAVGALTQLASAKRSGASRSALCEQPYAQYATAKAEALTLAGAAHVRNSFEPIWASALAGEAVSLRARALCRAACVHAVEASVEAAELCARAAGGHAVLDDQPFGRAVRDSRAAQGHIVFQRSMMEDAGRVAFGLQPLVPMF